LRFLQLRKIGRKAMTKQATLSGSAHADSGYWIRRYREGGDRAGRAPTGPL